MTEQIDNVLPFDRGSREDEEARRRIETSLGESLLVEAAAGTGKTTVLVARVVAMLRAGEAKVESLVAVTFTRKAAGELKLRLRQELDRARTQARDRLEGVETSGDEDEMISCREELENLEAAIARLEEARIGTIHSFCADILRERPVEAGIDPGFEEVADGEAPQLYQQAFDRFIQERLEDLSPALRRALSRLALDNPFAFGGALERLAGAGWNLVEWRDFPAPWRVAEFDREWGIDEVVKKVQKLAGLLAQGSSRDELVRALEPVALLATWIERAEELRSHSNGEAAQPGERDYDELEARLIRLKRDLNAYWRKKSGRGSFAEGVPREQVVAERDSLREVLDKFEAAANANLVALLQAELRTAAADYEELKRRVGKLDFTDLLIETRNLLRSNREVREHLQQRFTHLFVDEFQDTDPLQSEILMLLASDDPDQSDWTRVRPVGGKLFLVGDPKQSIYRFRRADVRLYEEIKEQLGKAGVEVLYLSRSFRAVPSLQRMINAAFEPVMDGDREAGNPEYVALRKGEREDVEGQPSVVVLPVPRPWSDRSITNKEIEASWPDAAAAYVAWLLQDSGWTVQDPESGERVPIRPRHICLLFRRFLSWGNDVTRPYISALERHGVAHLLIGSRTFHQREEVESLRAALIAIEWPDDELAMWSTLRGSLFSFDDETLWLYRHEVGTLHPFRRDEGDVAEIPEALRPVREALDLLADLHHRRNRRAIVQTLHQLLDRTRAHAGFALRPAGHQVLANVERVLDLARGYELGGGRSFRGFVEQLNAESERPGTSESSMTEDDAEGVRLMTVHNAKGLEFPVVLLADMTCNLASKNPQRTLDPKRELCAQTLLGWVPIELHEQRDVELERDRAEGLRIAYVAATRARDLLVIPAVGEEPRKGWLEPLNDAIFPSFAETRRRSDEAPGCPPFGESSVLWRPSHKDGQVESSVRPGLHRFPQTTVDGKKVRGGAQEYAVVWWDPATLPAQPDDNFGLRQEEILAEDDGGEVARQGMEQYERWRELRQEVLEEGAMPRFTVQAVTDLEEAPPEVAASPVRIETTGVERSGDRPSGARFGTLVHTLLRDVEWGVEREEVAAMAQLQGRLLEATDDEVAAATDSVVAALGHPLLVRAAEMGDEGALRELPFALELEGGWIIEGSMDLVLDPTRAGSTPEADDELVVIDFKTDADLEERREHYERQLAWYLFALERMTGRSARGVLMTV